jgi:hypothetical protein
VRRQRKTRRGERERVGRNKYTSKPEVEEPYLMAVPESKILLSVTVLPFNTIKECIVIFVVSVLITIVINENKIIVNIIMLCYITFS